MGTLIEVKVPDIGDFKEVEVIEVLVKPGETIAKEQSLITVESDKASMEIPSSHAGTVKEMRVKLGDKVSEGVVVLDARGRRGRRGGTRARESSGACAGTSASASTGRRRAAAAAPRATSSYQGRSMSNARSSSSVRDRAATRPPSAPPTSAARRC